MKIPDNYDLWLAYEREQERRRADEEDDSFFEELDEEYERECTWLDNLYSGKPTKQERNKIG